MNIIHGTQRHLMLCDAEHDIYFLSSVDAESSQHLFTKADFNAPRLRVGVSDITMTGAKEPTPRFIDDLYSCGEFFSDVVDSEIQPPDKEALRGAFLGGRKSTYALVGVNVWPESIKFAIFDHKRYVEFWDARQHDNDPENDDEIPINYGIWLSVPIDGLLKYGLHIRGGFAVSIRSRHDYIKINEVIHPLMKYHDETIYTINRIREMDACRKGRLAVVDIKEIHRNEPGY